MNHTWLRLGGFLVLVLATLTPIGCQLEEPLPPDLATGSQPEPSGVVQAAAAPAPPPPGSEGRLAYIGSDGNVYVTTADRQSTTAITSDAQVRPEGQGLSYHRVAWSPNGWLAIAAVIREGNAARSKLYVLETLGSPPRLVAESNAHFISYISWSPAACPGRPACQHLAYLIREGNDIGLHLVEIDGANVQDRQLAADRPIYFSWSPDGRHMLWHTGGARQENPGARVVLYDVEVQQATTLLHTPGRHLAPAWSPSGADWLTVSAEQGKDQLQWFGPQGVTAIANAADNEITFAWSPTGEQVAYAVRESGSEDVFGPIHIWDRRTGQTKQATDASFRILGFFWAPDGQRLAYLTRLGLPKTVWTQWRTFDLVTGKDRGFATFFPSPHMQRIVAGFSQHVQSHRFWSPDGRYLAYSDRDDELVDRIWLVDTWADHNVRPTWLAEGCIAIWSWN